MNIKRALGPYEWNPTNPNKSEGPSEDETPTRLRSSSCGELWRTVTRSWEAVVGYLSDSGVEPIR